MNFTLADHALDLEVLHVLARVGRRREDRFSLEVLLDHRLEGERATNWASFGSRREVGSVGVHGD